MPADARRSLIAALLPGLLLLIGPGSPHVQPTCAQNGAEASETSHDEPDVTRLRAARLTLQNPGAPLEERRDAASLLLDSDDPSIRAMLHRAVLDDAPPGARRAIAEAAGAMDATPQFIAPVMSVVLERAHEREIGLLLPVFATLDTQDAVNAVVGLLRRDPPLDGTLLDQTISTLARQTAREDLTTPAQWLNWWDTHRADSPDQWYRALARARAERNRALEDDRRRLGAEVERLYRQLHALTPVGERSPMIAELIRSDQAVNVRIGFELAHRTLLNARSLGPEVVAAGIARLRDADAAMRREASRLLDRMDPPDVGPRVAEALRTEDDPEAAAAMLRIIARQPQPDLGEAVTRWASEPGPARDPALGAGAALLASGNLPDRGRRARLEAAAREAVESGQASVASLRFLAGVGRTDLCVPLLASPSREIVVAAGEALAPSPEHLGALIEAARGNAELFPSASRALQDHDATGEGLDTLLSLPAPNNGAEMAESVSQLARRLSPGELLGAARTIDSVPLRLAALAHVASPDFMTNPRDDDARRELLALLLDARLDADDPDGVLQALGALQNDIETAPFASQRVAALLRLGRIDDAEQVDGVEDVPPATWLAALDVCRDQPFAAQLAGAILDRFGATLTDEQLRRLEEFEPSVEPAASSEGETGAETDEALGQAPSAGAIASPMFR